VIPLPHCFDDVCGSRVPGLLLYHPNVWTETDSVSDEVGFGCREMCPIVYFERFLDEAISSGSFFRSVMK